MNLNENINFNKEVKKIETEIFDDAETLGDNSIIFGEPVGEEKKKEDKKKLNDKINSLLESIKKDIK